MRRYFMAPEVVKQKVAVTAKADIWSLGGVVVQMATGMAPWQDRSFESLGALLTQVSLFTVTFCANPAHDWTCPPSYIII